MTFLQCKREQRRTKTRNCKREDFIILQNEHHVNAQYMLGYIKFMHLYCVKIFHFYYLLAISLCLKVKKTGVLNENHCLPEVTERAFYHITVASNTYRHSRERTLVNALLMCTDCICEL